MAPRAFRAKSQARRRDGESMRTSSVVGLAAVVAVALGAAPAWAEGEASSASAGAQGMLQLSSGTVQLAGDFSFTSIAAVPERGGTQSGFVFSFTPSGGYFVADGFELLAGLRFTVPFGDLYDNAARAFGFSVGARYHVGLAERVAFYGGLNLGVAYSWAEYPFVGNVDDTGLAVSLDGGVLVALSPHVALNAGLRFVVDHAFDAKITYLSFPVGLLGVEAFF